MTSIINDYRPSISKLRAKVRLLNPGEKKILHERAKLLYDTIKQEEKETCNLTTNKIERALNLYNNNCEVEGIKKMTEMDDYEIISAICLQVWEFNATTATIDLTNLIKHTQLDEFRVIRLIDKLLLAKEDEPLQMLDLTEELYILPCDAILLLTMIYAELKFPETAKLFEVYLSNPDTGPASEEQIRAAEKEFNELLESHVEFYSQKETQKFEQMLSQFDDGLKELKEINANKQKEVQDILDRVRGLNNIVKSIPEHEYQIETFVSDSSESESENVDGEEDVYVIAEKLSSKWPNWLAKELCDSNLFEHISPTNQFCFAPISKIFPDEPQINQCEGFIKCQVEEQNNGQWLIRGTHPALSNASTLQLIDLNELAMGDAPSIRCSEGTRVLATCDRVREDIRSCSINYFPGTVAVQPFSQNRFEYLVFFDNDVEAYVKPEDIRLMFDQPRTSDGKFQPRLAHTKIRTSQQRAEFIRKYLTLYPDWPLVQLKKLENTQRILATRNGTKDSAFVLDVDRHFALLRFPGQLKAGWTTAKTPARDCVVIDCKEHTHVDEWIYRGNESRFPNLAKSINFRNIGLPNQNAETNLRYRKMHSHFEMAWPQNSAGIHHRIQEMQELMQESQTARKSTSSKQSFISPFSHQLSKQSATMRSKQQARQQMVKEQKLEVPEWIHERPSQTHQIQDNWMVCSSKCLANIRCPKEQEDTYRSPYLIPLQRGWTRLHHKLGTELKSKQWKRVRIQYIAPCGIRLNNLKQVADYLHKTGEKELTIDMFTFDAQVRPNVRIVLENIVMKDFTDGQEALPISLTNTINEESPPKMVYRPRRTVIKKMLSGLKRVSENKIIDEEIDQHFCAGCECEDDCGTNEDCACRKRTIEANNRLSASLRIMKNAPVGYDHRQLRDKHLSGIYECNSHCKCIRKTCFNRVVQQDLKIPLQLFMTTAKGWGVRTLVDIPEFTFICTYAGELLNEDVADFFGKKEGDRYLCNLDLIDNVQNEKELQGIDLINDEGYAEEEGRESVSTHDSDVLVLSEGEILPESSEMDEQMKALRRKASSNRSSKSKAWKLEDYFGKNSMFVIDAARTGNIGRFLNHSCDPNCIIQNCFVDSHDLRLHWCAFFTNKFVKAGEELTWHYGYDTESMEKTQVKIDCKCGSSNCRGRLL